MFFFAATTVGKAVQLRRRRNVLLRRNDVVHRVRGLPLADPDIVDPRLEIRRRRRAECDALDDERIDDGGLAAAPQVVVQPFAVISPYLARLEVRPDDVMARFDPGHETRVIADTGLRVPQIEAKPETVRILVLRDVPAPGDVCSGSDANRRYSVFAQNVARAAVRKTVANEAAERSQAIVVPLRTDELHTERIPGETLRKESPFPRFPMLEVEKKALGARGGTGEKSQCQKCHKLPQHSLQMRINTRVSPSMI